MNSLSCEAITPANLHRKAQMQWVHGSSAHLKVASVEVGECVVDKSMHGAVRAVHILVDHPRDEVRRKGDDKCLEERANIYRWTFSSLHLQNLSTAFSPFSTEYSLETQPVPFC